MVRRLGVVLGACLLLATPAAGDNGKLGELQSRTATARAREARLNAQISHVTALIRTLEGRVVDVSKKLSVLEQDLALHQRRLDRLNALYSFETKRLNLLRREFARVVRQLNLRMIDIYETRDPTLVDVILESSSLQDALDQIHYLEAIARQDKRIATDVAVARDAVHLAREQTKRVRAHVHAEVRVIAVRTQQQRDARNQLLASQRGLADKRGHQRSQLASTRE